MRLVPASGLCVLLLQLALRFFGQQVRHTLQADADGGKIMQHSRGCRLQNAQCAQNDQGRVKAQHKAIVARHIVYRCDLQDILFRCVQQYLLRDLMDSGNMEIKMYCQQSEGCYVSL